MPAQQRLGPLQFPVAHAVFGLVVDLERVRCDRLAQLAVDRSPALSPLGQCGLEYLVTAPPVFLRVVERDVRRAQHRLDVLRVIRIDRDAHAAGVPDPLAVEHHGLGEHGEQPGRDAGRVLDACDPRQQQREFVAAQPRERRVHEPQSGIAPAQPLAKAVRDDSQQFVSRAVAVGVVDRFEAIEIDVHHRQRARRRARCGKRALEPKQKEAAVRQTCEAVEAGLMQQLSLRLLPGRDVLNRNDAMPPFVALRADHASLVAAARVGVGAGEELAALAARIFQQAPQAGNADDATVQQAVAAPRHAQQRERRRISIDDPALSVDEDQRLQEVAGARDPGTVRPQDPTQASGERQVGQRIEREGNLSPERGADRHEQRRPHAGRQQEPLLTPAPRDPLPHEVCDRHAAGRARVHQDHARDRVPDRRVGTGIRHFREVRDRNRDCRDRRDRPRTRNGSPLTRTDPEARGYGDRECVSEPALVAWRHLRDRRRDQPGR